MLTIQEQTSLYTSLIEEDSLLQGCEISAAREDTAARQDLEPCVVCEQIYHRLDLEPCGPILNVCPTCRNTVASMPHPDPYQDPFQDARDYAQGLRGVRATEDPWEWSFEECLAYDGLIEGIEIALYHDERRTRIWIDEYADTAR